MIRIFGLFDLLGIFRFSASLPSLFITIGFRASEFNISLFVLFYQLIDHVFDEI